MIANIKIELILIEDGAEAVLEPIKRKQITRAGREPITASELKTLVPQNLFDTNLYKKVKDEVWGSSSRAPLQGETNVSVLPNVTYVLYVSKK